MSRTHSAGSRKSSTCQSATQIVFRIAVVAGKMRTSQTENSFHLGRRYVDGQQFSREPQIDDAPVGLGKALPNVPALHPALIDSDGSLGSNRGPWVAYGREAVGSNPRCRHRLSSHLRGRRQQVLGGARENRTGFDNLYPRSVTADRTSRELLVGEASQSSQVTPVGAGQVTAISVRQMFAHGRRQGRFQRCGADANPSLEMARAGAEHHAGLMTISSHEFKDTRWGVIKVEENIAGIAILGIGEQIYVVTLPVACAQKADRGSTHQLTRIPKPFSRTHSACGMVNQTDEVEFIRHSRQLAADSVQGKEKSAVGHGFETAIEAPRRYNDFSANGNNPLNSVSQSKGALQSLVLPSHTTGHAGPHPAVRRIKLGVNSRVYRHVRRQETIRSLHRCPLELHSYLRPEGQQSWLFLPLVVLESAQRTCPFLYSPCGVPFGPSITVPGSAYLLLRLSALECLNSFADCMTYFALC